MQQITTGLDKINNKILNQIDTSKTGYDMMSKTITKFQNDQNSKQSSNMMVQVALNDL